MLVTYSELEKLIIAAAPHASSSVLEQLGASDSTFAPDRPVFTGFKGLERNHDYAQRYSFDPTAQVEIDDQPTFVYVAQWCYIMGSPATCIYVNMPGVESGEIAEDGTFDIGTERTMSDAPQEEIDQMVKSGYAKLMELVNRAKLK